MRGRPDREDYVFIGLIIAVLSLFWLSYSYQSCSPLIARCFFDGIKEWQTLLTGLIALLAAYVAFIAARMGVEQAERHELARIERQYMGAKALLPSALTLLHEYSDQVQEHLRPLATHFEGDGENDPPDLGDSPKVPEEAIRLIAELIKSSPTNLTAPKHLAELLSALQIQSSRLAGLGAVGPGIKAQIARGGILGALQDIFEVQWISDRFYTFARGQREDVKISDESLLEATVAPTFWAMDFPKLAQDIKAKKNIIGTIRSRSNGPEWD